MSQGMYKIAEAQQGRTYTGKHGDLVVWLVKLENATAETPGGWFELHKKPGNTPQPGDAIEVKTFSPGEHDGTPYVRIFVDSQNRSGGGSTASAGTARQSDGPGLTWKSAPYERGAEHPRNEARMNHTSALSVAPGLIDQMLTLSVVPAPKSKADYLNLLAGVAQWVEASYAPVLDAVAAPQAAAQPSLPQEVPVDTQGLGNGAPQTADESISF